MHVTKRLKQRERLWPKDRNKRRACISTFQTYLQQAHQRSYTVIINKNIHKNVSDTFRTLKNVWYIEKYVIRRPYIQDYYDNIIRRKYLTIAIQKEPVWLTSFIQEKKLFEWAQPSKPTTSSLFINFKTIHLIDRHICRQKDKTSKKYCHQK